MDLWNQDLYFCWETVRDLYTGQWLFQKWHSKSFSICPLNHSYFPWLIWHNNDWQNKIFQNKECSNRELKKNRKFTHHRRCLLRWCRWGKTACTTPGCKATFSIFVFLISVFSPSHLNRNFSHRHTCSVGVWIGRSHLRDTEQKFPLVFKLT